MRFRAIIFDLDGTAIPNRRDGMPSARLISIVNELRGEVQVCAATGRPISVCRDVLRSLGLVSPCIISGGTQIIDPQSEKILWEKLLSKNQVSAIIDCASDFDYQIYFSNETQSAKAREKEVTKGENIVYIMAVSHADTAVLLDRLGTVPDIIAHPVPSWMPQCYDVHVTHREATKKHALEALLDMVQVNKDEVVGFGDGNNDLPIFEAVGYRVAMVNGSEDLKKVADEIAPSAEEDGVAEVLETIFNKP